MNYINSISEYVPANQQEHQDKKVILRFIDSFPNDVLLRSNEVAHITSSGFIMNNALDKALLVHHTIRNVWAWTGGHADGEADLLQVALKEAREETGVREIAPLFDSVASVDILPVYGHYKKGQYVNAHLHLSIAYLLICEDTQTLHICPEENSGVEWFSTDRFTNEYFDDSDVYLYNKLIHRAKGHRGLPIK